MKTVRFYETDFIAEDKPIVEQLKKDGLFIYGLRDTGGISYTIERYVIVNNIGYFITDTDLEPYMHELGNNAWISDYELFHLPDIKLVRDSSLEKPSIPVERLDLTEQRKKADKEWHEIMLLQEAKSPIEMRYKRNRHFDFMKEQYYQGICIQYVQLDSVDATTQTVGYFTEDNHTSRKIDTKRNLHFLTLIKHIKEQEELNKNLGVIMCK